MTNRDFAVYPYLIKVAVNYCNIHKTKVDINGNPIQGQRPMTHGERKAFWKLIKEIIRSLNPWL